MKQPKIGALICAYNEEKHIRKTINDSLKQIKDVIVVNDGSKDNTLREVRKTKAILLNHPKNLGKGQALRTGFDYFIKNKYDYLITLDADGQHDPREIKLFIHEIKRSKPDLIIGYRKKRHSGMPYLRRFVNFFTSLLISVKGKTKIKDSQSGYRAIKVDFLKKLNLVRTSYDLESEILMKSMKQKAKIINIPITTIYGDEKSSINPIKETYRFFRTLKND